MFNIIRLSVKRYNSDYTFYTNAEKKSILCGLENSKQFSTGRETRDKKWGI